MALETSTVLQEKVWYGQLPVVFSLHPSDVTTLHAPRPFYAMIPRQSYLVTQTRAVIEYFRDAALTGLPGQSIWFEYQGKPLKWHLPFGLLYDLMTHADQTKSVLPWSIVVHFQGFPINELLPCDNEHAVESHFMHSLKQSMFLRTGSTKIIMGMPQAQQSQIWTSVTQNDFANYQVATRDLQIVLSSTASLRFVPMRFYFSNEPALQMPITPYKEASDLTTEKTLGDVVQTLLPNFFPQDETSLSHCVLIHGLIVPHHIPILALYQSFAYADGFLHISIIDAKE